MAGYPIEAVQAQPGRRVLDLALCQGGGQSRLVKSMLALQVLGEFAGSPCLCRKHLMV